MPENNAWSDPGSSGAENAARMAEFLQERSQRPDQRQVNEAICCVLSPQPGERLLEVGSGTGELCRLAARGPAGPLSLNGGRITGLDVSLEFIRTARSLAAGPEPGIIYMAGRAEALPFSTHTFDGAWAARLLLHVKAPEVVAAEMLRVLKPGGRAVLADWDFETLVVDHPNRELTRRLLHWRCDHHGGDNWSGRRLFALLAQAGFTSISVHPETVTARDDHSALTHSIWRAAEVARESGAITAIEHDDWVGNLRERLAAGRFFAGMTYFIVKGVKE